LKRRRINTDIKTSCNSPTTTATGLIHPINPATVIAMKTAEANMETDIQELARKYSSAAIAVLAELMCDEEAPASVRLAAAKTLLERGWGRATAGKSEERPAQPATQVRQSGARERTPGQDASPIPQSPPGAFASGQRVSRPEPKQSPHDPEPRRRNRTGEGAGAENRPRPEAWAG